MATPEQRRKWHLRKVDEGYYRKRNRAYREQVFDKLGDTCITCGYADKRALQIDHVNDDGYAERKILRNNWQRYKAVLADEEDRYQILCANCNFIKKYENNLKKYGDIYGSGTDTGAGAGSAGEAPQAA